MCFLGGSIPMLKILGGPSPKPLESPKIAAIHPIKCKWPISTKNAPKFDVYRYSWNYNFTFVSYGLFENTLWFWPNFQRVEEFVLETIELSQKTLILYVIISYPKFWMKDFRSNIQRFALIFDHFQFCTDFRFVRLKALNTIPTWNTP